MPRAEVQEGLLLARGGAADGCVSQELRRPRIPLATVACLFSIVTISRFLKSDPPPPPTTTPPGSKVAVELYSTALDQPSIEAVQTLDSTFIHIEGIFQIATFRFVPWGRSYFGDISGDTQYQTSDMRTWLDQCGQAASHPVPKSCWTGKALCPYGENECLANKIQGCVVHLFEEIEEIADGSESKPKFWDFIHCYGNNIIKDQSNDLQVPVRTLDTCGRHLSHDNRLAVKECYNGTEGRQLQVEAANATVSLSPRLTLVPWITVDGTFVTAGEVLVKVCESYRGPEAKPAACPRVVGQ